MRNCGPSPSLFRVISTAAAPSPGTNPLEFALVSRRLSRSNARIVVRFRYESTPAINTWSWRAVSINARACINAAIAEARPAATMDALGVKSIPSCVCNALRARDSIASTLPARSVSAKQRISGIPARCSSCSSPKHSSTANASIRSSFASTDSDASSGCAPMIHWPERSMNAVSRKLATCARTAAQVAGPL